MITGIINCEFLPEVMRQAWHRQQVCYRPHGRQKRHMPTPITHLCFPLLCFRSLFLILATFLHIFTLLCIISQWYEARHGFPAQLSLWRHLSQFVASTAAADVPRDLYDVNPVRVPENADKSTPALCCTARRDQFDTTSERFITLTEYWLCRTSWLTVSSGTAADLTVG